MRDVILALGTNLGDKRKNLAKSIEMLTGSITYPMTPVQISDLYETEPVGFVEQDAFYNMVIHVKTHLTPMKILERIQEIEEALKRIRTIQWGPRTIDIDILYYGDEHIRTEYLEIPHPRIMNRGFVLIPLKDLKICHQFVQNIDECIKKCEDSKGVIHIGVLK